MSLNKAQIKFMKFCMETPEPHFFQWREGPGEAEGPPEKWDRLRVCRHGPKGLLQCTIGKDDLRSIPKKLMKTFTVTAAGKRAIAQAEAP
jgi:hypothetical protein